LAPASVVAAVALVDLVGACFVSEAAVVVVGPGDIQVHPEVGVSILGPVVVGVVPVVLVPVV
jgi:hypothetical protein